MNFESLFKNNTFDEELSSFAVPLKNPAFDISKNNFIFPFFRSSVAISGGDRESFLQGLTTNDVKKIPNGKAAKTFFTSNKGKILFDTFIYKSEEIISVFLNSGKIEALKKHLDSFHIIEDVEIKITKLEHLTIDLIFFEKSEALFRLLEDKHFHLINESNRKAVFLIEKTDFQRNIKVLENKDIQWIGTEDFDNLRPYLFEPKFGVDFNENHFPHEIGLETLVSFTKGCFVGQEPIARIQHKGKVNKRLYSFSSLNPIQRDFNFIDNGVDVGTVTTKSECLIDGLYYGIGFFKTKWVDQLDSKENIPLNQTISIIGVS